VVEGLLPRGIERAVKIPAFRGNGRNYKRPLRDSLKGGEGPDLGAAKTEFERKIKRGRATRSYRQGRKSRGRGGGGLFDSRGEQRQRGTSCPGGGEKRKLRTSPRLLLQKVTGKKELISLRLGRVKKSLGGGGGRNCERANNLAAKSRRRGATRKANSFSEKTELGSKGNSRQKREERGPRREDSLSSLGKGGSAVKELKNDLAF